MINSGQAIVSKFHRKVYRLLPAFIFFQLVAALIVFNSETHAADLFANQPELKRLAAMALGENKDLQSKAENVRALYAEVPFAGSLENPRLGVGLANIPTDTFDLDQEPMTQKQIFISQKFPWFGKLELAEQIAGLDAARAAALYQADQLKLIRQLTQLWFDLDFIGHSLTTNLRLKELITQILRIAETRYATGDGLQQDILEAQVQLSKLINEHIDLKSEEQKLFSSIGELLNTSGLYTRDSLLKPPQVLEPLEDTEQLMQQALLNNPILLAETIAEERARQKVALAEKDYGPDMDFRLSYGQREDDPVSNRSRADFFSAVVTFSVPLWQATRQDSKLEAMEIRQVAAEKSIQSFKNTLPHRIKSLVSDINAAQENASLLDEALTLQAEQLAEASLASYSVGKVDFDTMLQARVNTLRFELQAQKYRYTALKKSAELNELLGEPAEIITTIAQQSTISSSGE